MSPRCGPPAGEVRACPERPWVRPVLFGPEEGPPLLALPPAQGHWRVLAPCLAPLGDLGARVALVSLRGERDLPTAPAASLDDLVADAFAAADACGFERFALMGTSFGGVVALAAAAARPERVECVILNVTAAHLDAHRMSRRLLRRLPRPLRGPAFHAWAFLACLPEMLRLGSGLPAALRRFRGIGRRHRTPDEALLSRIELMLAADLRPVLGRVEAPALVLSGGRRLDRLVPARCQDELARGLPRATRRTLDRVGHLGVLTAPERVRAEVAAFLGLVERAPPD